MPPVHILPIYTLNGGCLKTTMLMAMTLDGKIAKDSYHFPDWTGSKDKKLFVDITKKAGVVICGSKTFDTIGKALPCRKNIVITRNKNRISESDNLLFTDESPEKILKDLEAEGFSEAIICGGAIVDTLFAKKKLIDEIILTISPVIFGKGISLFADDLMMHLELKEIRAIDENLVFVRYAVI